MPRNHKPWTIVFCALLSACAAVGPDYQPPEIHTPDAWSEQISAQVEADHPAALQTWWTLFDDPELNSLIDRARRANLDLKLAVSRVRASRAALAGVQGERLPTVNAGAGAAYARTSELDTPAGASRNNGLFELGVDAGWEIDVFGRVRRSIEAAGANYQASIEDYRDVLVTLLAEVALAYVDIRGTQQRIVSTEANAAAQRLSLDLAEDRFRSGVSSRLDVVQARANLEVTEAGIPLLRLTLTQAINRLAVLLGEEPGSLQAEFAEIRPLPEISSLAGIGVPADVLRQRPDIRRAERLLAAQTAQVGVATADLYPSFSLGGFFGLQSLTLSSLFSGSSVATGVQLPVQWTIFSGGQIRANIDVQSEGVEQRLLEYENQVLQAVEQVENEIAAFNLNQARSRHLQQATRAIAEAVDLVLVQYNAGLTDFNNVLVTQRDLLAQQDQLIATDTDVVMALIALYKALGGGWDLNETVPAVDGPSS